jgi:hypothetical protein
MPFYAGIGSRETPAEICRLMTNIAIKLAQEGYTLRSGAADGADRAFELGADIDGGAKEIYIPWLGFNGSSSKLTPTPEAFEMAEKYHPAWHKCNIGARKLHARNCHQVLGYDLKTPVDRVICWTKDAAGGGGTGQTLRVAKGHHITIDDLGDPEIEKIYRYSLKVFGE